MAEPRYVPYVQAAMEAERRIAKGERQLYCLECGGLWRWVEECAHDGRMTYKEFRTMVARLRRQVRRRHPTQGDRYDRELAAAIRKGEL